MSITSLHMTRTHDFMAAIKATCDARRLPMPDIRDVRITERNNRVYSFAIFSTALWLQIGGVQGQSFSRSD